ncbi:MAG: BlaI/MecI/CopY family transcriptional regulator [Planctomycetaceae bacterium]
MRDLGSSQPTAAELEILRIVWAIEPCTVGDVHARLVADKGTNYSTTMKMLSLMLGKGLLVRDERASPHRYRARLTRNKARRSMLGELIEKVYEGSAMGVALQALSHGRATPEEIAEARALLDRLERRQS